MINAVRYPSAGVTYVLTHREASQTPEGVIIGEEAANTAFRLLALLRWFNVPLNRRWRNADRPATVSTSSRPSRLHLPAVAASAAAIANRKINQCRDASPMNLP